MPFFRPCRRPLTPPGLCRRQPVVPGNTRLYNNLALFLIIVPVYFNVNMLLTDLPKYLYIYLSLYGETGGCGAHYCPGAGMTNREWRDALFPVVRWYWLARYCLSRCGRSESPPCRAASFPHGRLRRLRTSPPLACATCLPRPCRGDSSGLFAKGERPTRASACPYARGL